MAEPNAESGYTDRYALLNPEVEALLSVLTRKQELFCREYFISLNGRAAAEKAGYKGNPNTLRAIASENLTKPNIAAVMDAFFQRKAQEFEINAGVIEAEYWKLYHDALNAGERAVARQCLKDLGEHHAMFVKVIASTDAAGLADRLNRGRERMNARQMREAGADPRPEAVAER